MVSIICHILGLFKPQTFSRILPPIDLLNLHLFIPFSFAIKPTGRLGVLVVWMWPGLIFLCTLPSSFIVYEEIILARQLQRWYQYFASSLRRISARRRLRLPTVFTTLYLHSLFSLDCTLISRLCCRVLSISFISFHTLKTSNVNRTALHLTARQFILRTSLIHKVGQLSRRIGFIQRLLFEIMLKKNHICIIPQ